jgi:mannitol 2-dehydrogenase
MVDRITPATEQSHKDLIAAMYGIQDNWPVVAEDFKQWVRLVWRVFRK